MASQKISFSSEIENLYILGAGSSAQSGVPLTTHFLTLIDKLAPKNRRVRNIKNFLNHYFTASQNGIFPKFEELLSFIDIALEKKDFLGPIYQEKELLQLKSDFNYLIWETLKFVKNLPEQQDIHFRFVEKKLTPYDAIISLNYDTLIDFALEKKKIPFTYGLQINEPQKKGIIPLIKVHGSLNWLYCPSCYTFFTYNHNNIEKIFAPQPELCPDDRSYLKGILIPPTYFKNYHHPIISQLWIKAGQIIKNSKNIYFIGLSFSNADIWIKYLIKKYLYLNPFHPHLFVVNPEQRGIVKRRFERILGNVNYLKMTFWEWINS